jgi:hypothetical protein
VTDFARIADLVNKGEFAGLFIGELGWDNPSDTRPVRYLDGESGQAITATPVASKRGVVAYHCPAMLDRSTLEALDREIQKRSIERLLVLTEAGQQQWRWPEPRKSGGIRYVTHTHMAGAPNPALFQRLAAVRFTIEEEAALTVLTVRERIRAQFNADEVTSRFYDEFRDNQQSLMEVIEGIEPHEERSWYSSLLLNRLMFIYFMQRKEFLNGDQNYLRSSLRAVRELQGPDRFYDYYRDFLIPLFHEGLGSDERQYADEDIAHIIGNVPYVNGGIFALHPLEAEFDIRVPDETFERIFDFFDRYRWHLDERPTGNPKEINPEILGYIFEKYVNQKAQGAYYTKEDVTGYMSAMAILPVLLDQISETTGETPWHLLRSQPNRYIPEGVLYGIEADILGPPVEVAQVDPTEADALGYGDVNLAAEAAAAYQPLAVGRLDDYAHPDVGLPGERWRETLARHERAAELRGSLSAGAIASSGAAISANLDLQTLMLDWITQLDRSEAIAAVWEALNGLKIVDPTCGSGAFLFAALDILEELYDATLSAAEKLLADGRADMAVSVIVEEAGTHESRAYFLLKRAVLANLYGVDLMPEATEIARLRLFLALVARLHERAEVEPLPDLDMNIRAGNLLVGCSTAADAAQRFQGDLLAIDRLDAITPQAEETAALYREFVEAQRDRQPAAVVNDLKTRLQEKTASLREELDLLYSPLDELSDAQDAWRESHRPFHWFVEFPKAFSQGGFDAVIGNPPYVAKSKITSYSYSGFATDASPDIYAPCIERAASLVAPGGGYSMIVPISFQFSDRGFDIARKAVLETLSPCWASTYSRNPSALFDAGLGVRSTILVARRTGGEPAVFTTGLRRWWDEGRPYLFDTNRYEAISLRNPAQPWPRLGSPETVRLYDRLTANQKSVGLAVTRSGPELGFKQTALYYLSVFIDEPPSWDMDGNRIPQTQVANLAFANERDRDLAFILLAGRLGVWWWSATGDDFHVTGGLLKAFPVSLEEITPIADSLLALAADLRVEQQRHPLATKYAGKEMGNYDMSRCRHITDQADQLVLDLFGIGDLWPTVLLSDASLAKVTGERPGTRREWPFPV